MALDEATLETVRAGMRGLQAVNPHQRVYKDECMLSYDTPFSAEGIYLNLTSLRSYGAQHLELDHRKTGATLYLLLRYTKVPKEPAAGEGEPTKLAIGVEGGFQTEPQFDVQKAHALVVMPAKLSIPLPCEELPFVVTQATDAAIAHAGTAHQEEVAAWQEEPLQVSKYAKDLVQLPPAGRKISPNPADWVCEESGLRENLWLNLSDGYIGSGRRNWDGTGGTGAALTHFEATGSKYPLVVKLGTITPQGADVYSYAPDEVRGRLQPDGDGDGDGDGAWARLSSAHAPHPTGANGRKRAGTGGDCANLKRPPDLERRACGDLVGRGWTAAAQNELVEDPYLAEHLSHWGIDVMKMEKTEKSMAELNVAYNKSFEFDKITEAGADLEPLAGKGYLGLKNLGNSCYMNSVMQVLFTLPELEQRYGAARAAAVYEAAPAEPEGDFRVQMTKLGVALTTDAYAAAAPAAGEHAPSVEPRAFKALVGKGHAEFSTGRQQDAVEYLQHLLEVMARAERAYAGADAEPAASTSSLFRFKMEERLQCVESGQVRYTTHAENVLGLEIPMDAAINQAAVTQYEERESAKRQRTEGGSADAAEAAAAAAAAEEELEVVRPVVPFEACLSALAATETIPDYHSSALGRAGPAAKTTRLATFPPYLAVQMKRFYVAADWTAKKRDVLVEAPETLSLAALRGTGLQPSETPLPEAAPPAAAVAPLPDDAIVAQLISMGFSENGSKRAALATSNVGAEPAMEWVFAHMEDADFNDPLPAPDEAVAAAAVTAEPAAAGAADPDSVAMLTSMGFTAPQAEGALKATSGNLERAADWLFSHADDLDGALAALSAPDGGSGGGGGGGGGGEGTFLDGAPEYELVGFVSHMGSNTQCGHYVCHIKKEGRWVLFNDEKVAVSQKPPKDLGYLYLYKRKAE